MVNTNSAEDLQRETLSHEFSSCFIIILYLKNIAFLCIENWKHFLDK